MKKVLCWALPIYAVILLAASLYLDRSACTRGLPTCVSGADRAGYLRTTKQLRKNHRLSEADIEFNEELPKALRWRVMGPKDVVGHYTTEAASARGELEAGHVHDRATFPAHPGRFFGAVDPGVYSHDTATIRPRARVLLGCKAGEDDCTCDVPARAVAVICGDAKAGETPDCKVVVEFATSHCAAQAGWLAVIGHARPRPKRDYLPEIAVPPPLAEAACEEESQQGTSSKKTSSAN